MSNLTFKLKQKTIQNIKDTKGMSIIMILNIIPSQTPTNHYICVYIQPHTHTNIYTFINPIFFSFPCSLLKNLIKNPISCENCQFDINQK